MRTLFAAALLAAFAVLTGTSAHAAKFMTVIAVETDDVAAYANFVGKLNRTWKAEKVHASGSVYVPAQAGEQVGVAYYVSFADNSADWMAQGTSTTNNKAVADVIATADVIRTRLDNSLYTALIDGGVYDDGVVYATFVKTTDTAAYLEAMGNLDKLMSANGLDDAKLSVYSAIAAGEGAGQLQVLMSLPNQARVAALLDAMSSDWLQNFLAGIAPIRTLQSNGIYMTVPTQ